MKTKRVLIIEDDADAASVLEAYLKRDGYDVMVASNGMTGLEQVGRWQPDLILLDVMLPVMNGTKCWPRSDAAVTRPFYGNRDGRRARQNRRVALWRR